MSTIQSKAADMRLSKLVKRVSATSRPVRVKTADASAVLVGEADWRAIQETLYLLSIPGMRQSIRKGLETPVNQCRKTLRW